MSTYYVSHTWAPLHSLTASAYIIYKILYVCIHIYVSMHHMYSIRAS